MFIPGLSLVGWILTLVALNEISDVVQDRSIFDNALIAGITAVLGSVVFLVFFLSGAFGVLTGFGRFALGTAAILIPVILGAFWVFAVISAVFLKRAYDKAAQRLSVNTFATAGLLYLIGALTTIILIGFVIILIALIFQVVAYFSIEDRPTLHLCSASHATIRPASIACAATDEHSTGSTRLQVLSEMRRSTCQNS